MTRDEARHKAADHIESTRRALREALLAINRGDATAAAVIARAHASQPRRRPGRVTLIVPLRLLPQGPDVWDVAAS